MKKKTFPKKSELNWLRTNSVRVARVHFAYMAAYAVSIIIFDSWNLFTHEAVSSRWTAAGIVFVLATLAWYVGRMKFKTSSIYVYAVLMLVAADLAFAGLHIYWERGLASKSVILFAIPLITAATLRSRSTLLATAALSTAVYSTAAVRYFYAHYGESFRVELYGYLFLFCSLFFIIAWLLWLIIRPTQEDFK